MHLVFKKPFLLLIALSVYALADIAASGVSPENQHCLRCHGMATLGYLDSLTGNIVDLSVDSLKYTHSNHAELKCTDCHLDDYQKYPHPASVKSENLYCLNCHKDEQKFVKYRFPEIEKELVQSVHYQKLGDKLNCFNCHNPHEFEIAKAGMSVPQIINKHNGICLSCHNAPLMFAGLTNRQFPDLNIAHSWLPETELHWQYVRCVECHTPHTEFMSHDILAADKAEKLCAECHTTNSILMTKLYKYETKEARQKTGFINSAAFNNAYVIGMTRNILLDKLSIVIFGLALLGIAGHAAGRYIAGRRRRK